MALGDSFTSGPGIAPAVPDDPCRRSEANYPSLVAADLGITDFTDVSCLGATTADLASPQDVYGTYVPAQYDALQPDTELVTVGIGGNDLGLVQLALRCINLKPPPEGTSCSEDDPLDGQIDAFAPVYDTIVDEIRTRSPHARIVFVGYPTVIRDEGCFPTERMWPQDAEYLQNAVDELGESMRRQSTSENVDYVDLRPSTIGHDACAAPDDRWLTGASLGGGVPLHPTAGGHVNAARQILDEIS